MCRGATMLFEQVLNTVNAEPTSARVGKQDIAVTAWRLAQPGFEDGPGGFGQGRTTLSPALADYPQVGTGSEDEIFTFESGHLREAEARLCGGQNECVIAPAGPPTSIGRGQQRIHFRTREETDQGSREALARDRENTLDLRGMLGQLKGRITKEGMDRRQAQITCSNADAIVPFQVI